MAFGRGRFSFMLAAALVGVSLACGPAQGQQDSDDVEERIETAFDIVPENTIDLAVPLTRRALAQRATDMGGLMPLGRARSVVRMDASAKPATAAPASPAQAYTASDVPEPSETAAVAARSFVAQNSGAPEPPSAGREPEFSEEGSAEGEADDGDVRLPRPRPAAEQALTGSPLDLVAGAALSDAEAAAADLDLADLDVTATAVATTPPETTAALPPGAVTVLPAQSPATTSPAAEVVTAPAASPNAPATELLASAECLAPDAVSDKDGDFRRNAAALVEPGLCIAEQKFKERRRPWTIQTVSSGRPGPLWAVMHDDEDIAFDSAVQALTTYGGTMVAMETGGKRNQDGIDPNRNFSADGVGCAKMGDSASPKFTGAFKTLLDPAQPVIVLHNNFDGHVPTGGLGHVSMSTVPKGMRTATSKLPDSPLADEHTLVLLAALEPIDPAVEERVENLSAAGINVVLEPVREAEGDCSLSNYSVLTGHKDYLNVTVDHDGGEKQLRIVDVIMRAEIAAAR
jgi:hypothetical protein